MFDNFFQCDFDFVLDGPRINPEIPKDMERKGMLHESFLCWQKIPVSSVNIVSHTKKLDAMRESFVDAYGDGHYDNYPTDYCHAFRGRLVDRDIYVISVKIVRYWVFGDMCSVKYVCENSTTNRQLRKELFRGKISTLKKKIMNIRKGFTQEGQGSTIVSELQEGLEPTIKTLYRKFL